MLVFSYSHIFHKGILDRVLTLRPCNQILLCALQAECPAFVFSSDGHGVVVGRCKPWQEAMRHGRLDALHFSLCGWIFFRPILHTVLQCFFYGDDTGRPNAAITYQFECDRKY